MQHMLRLYRFIGANCTMREVLVSLPMCEQLLDERRYFRPGEGTENTVTKFHMSKPSPERLVRALRTADHRPAVAVPRTATPPRGPSLRTLVRWALKCDSAEQLGKKIRQRYDRQHRHPGSPSAADDAEIDRLFGKG
jgi:hypothetical protein